ncbi:NAD binding domain of 6-phosphogluconate dehydrogenase-domain-containing protein [Xylariaceae sp. FL0804]|nr:NAD binding domain of 6-phosphogluconate dehydrogenase-domain-containing protein [Xylariaceae sp. FL0804]
MPDADHKPEVAFIGLGAMGFGMATHLVRCGYAVTGFDVYAPTLERFVAAGGRAAATPAAAVAGNGGRPSLCVVMVATAAQAQAVLFGDDGAGGGGDDNDKANAAVVPALAPGATLLLASTVPCAYVQGLAAQLAGEPAKDGGGGGGAGRGDVLLVDCPVSGGAARAADGTLSIMAGGSDAALASARPLLGAMADAQKLYVVPGGVGAGSNMKMCHQVLAAVHILAASEAMGLAHHLGLDAAWTASRIAAPGDSDNDAWAFMFEHRTPRMLTRGFAPLASALTIILKDTGIITSEARRQGFPTPMAAAAEQAYLASLLRGYGPDDDSGLVRLYVEGLSSSSRGGWWLGETTQPAERDEKKLALVRALLKGVYLCAAAEALAFAKRCGLDLDQVFELCASAAGASRVFEAVGPDIIKLLSRGELEPPSSAPGDDEDLRSTAARLGEVVDEAQRLRVPLYLGAQALTLLQLALQHAPGHAERLPRAMVARVWAV